MKSYLVTYNESTEQPNAAKKTVAADGYTKDDSGITFYTNVPNSTDTNMSVFFAMRSLVSVEFLP